MITSNKKFVNPVVKFWLITQGVIKNYLPKFYYGVKYSSEFSNSDAQKNAEDHAELRGKSQRKSASDLRRSASNIRMNQRESAILIHYHEVGLKGKNRAYFENKLKENIKKALDGIGDFKVERLPGRLIITYTDEHRLGTDGHGPIIKERLEKVFGIVYFSFTEIHRLAQMGKQIDADKLIGNLCEDVLDLIKDKKFKSFKIDTKRADKSFPMTSQEVNEKIGACILETLTDTDIKRTNTDIKVDLEDPDLTIFIEILSKQAFIYTKKIKGPGGLPVGVSGRVVSLISSGIDSPVASWNIMKRGAEVIFVHFHSYPKTNKASIENTEKLVKILNKYQFQSKLYLVPFLNIQKEILAKAPEKLRVILYRRAMFRIAEEVAKKEGARALVTGESLGQVASQTIENIEVISEAVKIPIFRPLIGQDKEEIIQLAKKISTYEASIQPYEDCCSLFVPQHPETKAKIEEVERVEKDLNLEPVIKEAIEGSKREQFSATENCSLAA